MDLGLVFRNPPTETDDANSLRTFIGGHIKAKSEQRRNENAGVATKERASEHSFAGSEGAEQQGAICDALRSGYLRDASGRRAKGPDR
jgi:hypothetical protein